MSPQCLFLHKKKCIGEKDFHAALRSIGIAAGDTIFVHSKLDAFGKLGPHYNNQELCKTLLGTLKKTVGPKGTVAMPTFTYAFCRNGRYDREKSPSEVGVFSEFFRKEKGAIRSLHPIFSVAARGPQARSLIAVDVDSFGTRSFFANLHKKRGAIVFLGAPFQSCTFVHHIEQQHKVPYRSIKTFRGTVKNSKESRAVESTYFVRPLGNTIIVDLSRFEESLRRKKLLKEMRVGAGVVSVVKVEDAFREGMHMLDKNVYAFLRKSPAKTPP